MLIIAPTLFAASIYMELGRITLLVHAPDNHLLISRRWLTKLFVCGDVISFALQCAGGGLMGSNEPSTEKMGSNIIVAGLICQIIFFGCFVMVAVLFHRRLLSQPPQKMLEEDAPYKRHMIALYITSILIFLRSIVRVVEFIQGFQGYIAMHEPFLYVFDAAPMLVVVLLLNWVHPSEVKSWLRSGGKMSKNLLLEDYQPLSKGIRESQNPLPNSPGISV